MSAELFSLYIMPHALPSGRIQNLPESIAGLDAHLSICVSVICKQWSVTCLQNYFLGICLMHCHLAGARICQMVEIHYGLYSRIGYPSLCVSVICKQCRLREQRERVEQRHQDEIESVTKKSAEHKARSEALQTDVNNKQVSSLGLPECDDGGQQQTGEFFMFT